ncbi:MAG: glycoside hydrolase family 32 protein [Propionibacteriaceae bacterium]
MSAPEPVVPGDPTFPGLHIRPPHGWLNDPNGVCRIDGRYHVFFQHNPDSPQHDAIQWGHASSSDLLSWRYEPLALRTRPGGLDAAGCWSGCITDDGGVPTAVYTAVPDHAWNGAVVLARSDRQLLEWEQGDKPVMTTPADPAIAEVRDPFVFTFDGHRYAVQGAGHQEGRPQLLAYACDDLTAWTELGPLLTDDDPIAAEVAPAQIWECPNLLQLGDRWLLIISLWRWQDQAHDLAGVRYLIGDLQAGPGSLTFLPTAGGVVDDGPTFYAPQAVSLPERALLWGWAWEQGRTEEQTEAAGWAGVLTYPRELSIVDDRLVSRPAAELVGLRRERLSWSPGVGFATAAFEIDASGPGSLALVQDGRDDIVVQVDGVARIFVDGSLVEVFGADTPYTTRAYPSADSVWVIRAEPGDVVVWRLGL